MMVMMIIIAAHLEPSMNSLVRSSLFTDIDSIMTRTHSYNIATESIKTVLEYVHTVTQVTHMHVIRECVYYLLYTLRYENHHKKKKKTN